MDETDQSQSKAGEKVDLDYMFVNDLGQFGKYQMIYIPLMCLQVFLGTMFNEYNFSVAAIPHRCMIEECGEVSGTTPFTPDWLENAVPWKNGNPTSCERYNTLGNNGSLDFCPAYLFDNRSTVGCDKFVYKRTDSMVYDFDLGCKDILRSLAGSMAFIGAVICLPLNGYLSDKYGRRIVLVGSVTSIAIFGIAKSFSINYPMYMVLTVLQTTFGYAGSAFIFVSEIVGPKYRVFAIAVCGCMSGLGNAWIGFVAWMFQDSWRKFLLVLNAPLLAYVLVYFVCPESIRWLLSKKKYDEMKKELRRIARFNGRTVNEKSLDTFSDDSSNDDVTKVAKSRPNPVSFVIKSRVLLPRVVILSILWVCSTFIYYGVVINSTSLSDDKYMNYILTGFMQVPGFLIPGFIPNIGRKTKLMVTYFLAGGCNAAFVFIPNDMIVARTTAYLLGMSSICAVSSTLYTYTAEVYPTECRHSLYNFSSMIGRIGSITAPLTPTLSKYWASAPSAMFAACGFLSCFLMIFLPETMGKRLPETLEQAENLAESDTSN